MLGKLAQVQAATPLPQPEPVEVYLWPECHAAWEHFWSLNTQWRNSGMGNTGLDYAGVRAYLDEMGVEPGPERRELFELLRAAEDGALRAWEQIRANQPKEPAPPGAY